MRYLTTILIAIVLLGVSSVAVWQWRESVRYQELLTARTEELQQANLEIGRAHTEIANQKIVHEKAISELDKKLQDEIKKNKALITMYAKLEAAYDMEKQKVSSLASTIEEILKAQSLADLPVGRLFYKKDDGTLASVKSFKWTWQDFRIDLDGELTADGIGPDKTILIKHDMSYKIHLRFRAKIIRTVLPNGVANHYGELYEIDPQGKDLGKLTLTSFEVIEATSLPKKMSWWNPKLDLTAGGIVSINKNPTGSFAADLGISLSSYGVTKDDINWRFFRFGIGYSSESAHLSFSPAMYNVGKNLPLVSNVWITPYGGYNFGLKAAIAGLGIGVVF